MPIFREKHQENDFLLNVVCPILQCNSGTCARSFTSSTEYKEFFLGLFFCGCVLKIKCRKKKAKVRETNCDYH